MSRASRGGLLTAATMLAAGFAHAQKKGEVNVSYGYVHSELDPTGDHMDYFFLGGVQVVAGELELRADRAVVRCDPDDFPMGNPNGGGAGLPRRGLSPPAERRLTTEALLKQRLSTFMQAAKGGPPPELPLTAIPWSLLQSVYLEGSVSILKAGQEVLRADSFHLSTVDDRTVMRNAELRLWGTSPQGVSQVLVVRGDELVKQGKRLTGRDVSVTTCNAGEPHLEVDVGEVEIIERANDFEVRTHDGSLVIGGVDLLPLPNASFFSSDQTNLPIKGFTAGYSSQYGGRAGVALGGSLNTIGGGLHEYLTGRPAEEFRGDWYSSVGYNQSRGWPLEQGFNFSAPDLYSGKFDSFYLRDHGQNRGPIKRELNGSLITKRDRSKIHTEDRFFIDENTTLDLTVFRLGDAAVWSEFFNGDYRTNERPETSVYLRRSVENRLYTVSGRWNLNSFSYESDRALAPYFKEELPFATFHMFSQPIATLPYDTPLLLTSGGSAGYLRNNFDNTLPEYHQDALRLDEELELAAPFQIGPVVARPFTSARITYYDDTPAGGDSARWAFTQGASLSTRISRAWTWTSEDGTETGLRHLIYPEISFVNRETADGQPQDFFQFDEVDTVDDETVLRLGLLNRLQHKHTTGPLREFLWLDLAQNITPITSQNDGHQLGLFEYDFVLRPSPEWVPVPGLWFRLQGEYDWTKHEARTFAIGTRFGKVLGATWNAQYSTDANSDGSINYGASTQLLDRWSLASSSQYDLGTNQTQNYSLRIIRQDHDWRIHMGLIFDQISNETRFFINFEPSIGGLIQPSKADYVSGSGFSQTQYTY